MSQSDAQFNELLAQVIVRGNKMLSESNLIAPFGILLDSNQSAEVIMAVDKSLPYAEMLDNLQESLKARVLAKSYLSGCIVYADYNNNQLVAFLENHNNYCLKALIPVKAENGLCLSADEMMAEEGGIYIFPVKQTH